MYLPQRKPIKRLPVAEHETPLRRGLTLPGSRKLGVQVGLDDAARRRGGRSTSTDKVEAAPPSEGRAAARRLTLHPIHPIRLTRRNGRVC